MTLTAPERTHTPLADPRQDSTADRPASRPAGPTPARRTPVSAAPAVADGSADAPGRSRTGIRYALSDPLYRRYGAASFISNTGSWMQRIAQDWLALEVTHGSATILGLVFACQVLPTLVAGPIGGSVADAVNARRGLAVVQSLLVLSALLLAAASWTGHVTLPLLFGCAGLLSLLGAFENPLRSRTVVQLAGRDRLPSVIATDAALGTLARLAGPALAGVTIATFGTAAAIAANALSFLPMLALLVCLPRVAAAHSTTRFTTAPTAQASAAAAPQLDRSWSAVRHTLRRRPDLVLVIAMATLTGTFALNTTITNALMVTKVYRMGPTAFGALGTCVGVGAFVGAVLAARRGAPRLRTVLTGAGLLAVTTLASAIAPTYLTFVALMAIFGIGNATFLPGASTYIQLAAPSHLRGRFASLYAMALAGATPLGAPVIGLISEHFGVRWALGTFGGLDVILLAAAAVLFLRKLPADDAHPLPVMLPQRALAA